MKLKSLFAAFAAVFATATASATAGDMIKLFQPEVAATYKALSAQSPTKRIIGGAPIRRNEFPFLVALVSSGNPDNFQAQFCGGSVLAKRFILTAAHCVAELQSPDDVQILVGTHDLESGGRRLDVVDGVIHANYVPSTFDFDIAVLEVATDITGIRPVRIMTAAQEKTLARPGRPLIVAGWGNTSTNSQAFPTIARKVTVPVVRTSTCNSAAAYNGQITNQMFCAGVMRGGKDSCQGDSGGPLFSTNRVAGTRIQMGVVSWGQGCAQRNKPGVYTRLAVFGKWLKDAQAALQSD